MFNPNEFIMKTLKGMVGNYPDFQVREYALGWWGKGKLTDSDMEEVDALIEAQYFIPEPPVVEETPTEMEEVVDEPTENNEEYDTETY